MIFIPKNLCAQENQNDGLENPMDDLGNVSDAFQENFFEALKQKAIENYELALNALARAEKVSTKETEAVVFFEMGKNYAFLNNYSLAEQNFQRVLKLKGDRLDVLEQLYDVYYQQNDYDKAITLVKKLIPFDEDYKEDLANLYTRTKQYDKAIIELDNLDEIWGESDIRNALRSQIYRVTGNTEGAIENLEEKIDNNPKNEEEFLKLIFLYSDQGNREKAFETAKSLLKNNPKSDLVHLALYKFYLDDGNTAESLKSMKIVFTSDKIDTESKYKVLGDFIQFVNENPDYESELDSIVSLFSEENGGKVYEKIGDYFVAKSKKEEALEFYTKGIKNDKDNYNLLKNTLLLQIEFKQYNEAAKLSSEGLEIFPSQALLYLLNGVANNNLGNLDVAIESLETGVDFLLNDPNMEKDFYEQLSELYSKKGDTEKASKFAKKASETKLPN